MEEKYIRVSFAAPAVVLNFLSFLYRITFIDEWQKNKGLMNNFYRSGTFSVAAPVSAWVAFFNTVKGLNPVYFHDRIGLLVFAVYLQISKFDDAFDTIKDMPDFVSTDDPILIKKGLFEIEMTNITNIEKSTTPFDVDIW